MLKKAGMIAAGVAALCAVGAGNASATPNNTDTLPNGWGHHPHSGEKHNTLVDLSHNSIGNGSLNNVGQCVAVPKPQVPVAVNGIGAAVPVAAQDIKPPVSLPEINVLGGHQGDSMNTTEVLEQTGNNNCAGGSGNGAGSGSGAHSGDGAAAGAGSGSNGDGSGIGW